MKYLPAPLLEWKGLAPYNKEYKDFYFNPKEGRLERCFVYCESNNLERLFKSESAPVIGELGFGSSLSFFCTLEYWDKIRKPEQTLWFISVEKSPWRKKDQLKVLSQWKDLSHIARSVVPLFPDPYEGFHLVWIEDYRCYLLLLYGEAAQQLEQLEATVDVWFLDGFNPKINKDLWCGSVFNSLNTLSHKDTSFSTFSSSKEVKNCLKEIGATFLKRKGILGKREFILGKMTSATPKERRQVNRIKVLGAGISGCAVANVLKRRNKPFSLIDQLGGVALKTSSNPKAVFHPKATQKHGVTSQLTWQGYNYTKQWIEQNLPTGHYAFEGVESNALFSKKDLHPNFYKGGWINMYEFCKTLALGLKVNTFLEEGQGVIVRCLGSEETIINELSVVEGSILGLPTLSPFKGTKVLLGKGYVVPDTQSKVWVGSTYVHSKNKLYNPVRALIEKAEENGVVVDLFNENQLWTGRRMTCRNRLPVCKRVGANEWVFNGLGSMASTTSLILAEHLVSSIFGDPCPLPKNINIKIKEMI